MNDTVSIIVPIYNSAAYIEACLLSLINQTYQNMEIILINDGSTDNSWEKCLLWKQKDKRIRIFSQENRGVSEARNLGLEKAVGDYVAFIDVDDTCDREMYMKMVQTLKKEDTDIVFCGMKRCYLSENRTEYQHGKTVGAVDKIEAVRQLSSLYFDCGCVNKVFRKKVIIEKNEIIRFSSDYQIGEDYMWMLKVLKKSTRVSLLGDCLYNYNIRQGSASHSVALDRKNMSHLYALEKCANIAKSISDDLTMDPLLRLYGQARILKLLAYCQKKEQYIDEINRLVDLLNCERIWFRNCNVSFISKTKQLLINCVYSLKLDGKLALKVYNLKRNDKLIYRK